MNRTGRVTYKIDLDGPLTFTRCRELCSNPSGWTKIANNTWVQSSTVEPGAFGVKLHQTEVLTVYADGSYRLNTGGHHTVTTCDRLNNLGPVPCRIKDGTIIAANVGPLYHATKLTMARDNTWEVTDASA